MVVRIDGVRDSDLGAIRAGLDAFWTGEPPLALHHPMFVVEFGDTALIARGEDGTIQGYLFGFVTPASVGYIHLVAVRDSARPGHDRELYEAFAELPQLHRDAWSLKAIANPANKATIAFHERMGFDRDVGT